MFYFVRTPGWLKKLYGGCIWQMPGREKIMYLSFDDGPHPLATPFVLDILKEYGAKATFFCIGKNVEAEPAIYKRVIAEGHAVGNHTFNHLSGWKTGGHIYLENVKKAQACIRSALFRPPYGKIKRAQVKLLSTVEYGLTTIMWTVLSGDFDQKITKERCLRNVLDKSAEGAIVVFHDSEKAFEKMSFVLPKLLAHFTKKGYRFEKIVV